MTGHGLEGYSIRRLWPLDIPAFLCHLKRLDPETRRARFGAPVNDDFMEHYAATANRLGTLVYGAFADGEIYASAELRPLDPFDRTWDKSTAEAAFTVEKDVQDHGLGSELMDRVITAAQNRRIGQLYMICLRENSRMQHIAEKFGARLKVEQGEVTGQIEPAFPTPVSLLDETMHEATAFITAVLDWRL